MSSSISHPRRLRAQLPASAGKTSAAKGEAMASFLPRPICHPFLRDPSWVSVKGKDAEGEKNCRGEAGGKEGQSP